MNNISITVNVTQSFSNTLSSIKYVLKNKTGRKYCRKLFWSLPKKDLIENTDHRELTNPNILLFFSECKELNEFFKAIPSEERIKCAEIEEVLVNLKHEKERLNNLKKTRNRTRRII